MKVFITGGTGFIGKHLVQRLSRTMHTVRCLARKGSRTQELEDLGASIAIGDITDKDSLRAGMEGCDWVVHLADVNAYWVRDKAVYQRTNVEGVRTVMECALEADVSKVVHVSSMEVYGKPRISPISEHTPMGLFRFSHFSQAKHEGDLIAWQLYHDNGLPLVVVYPGVVLGSGDGGFAGNMIRRLIERRMPVRLFSNSTLTFVHVDDVAEAILKAAEKHDNIGEKYFVGNTWLTLKDFYDLVSDVSDVPSPILRMPDVLAIYGAHALTWIADRIIRPPLFDLSSEAAHTLMEGFKADGSKAESELGIVYSSIRKAVEEECAWHRSVLSKTWEGQERRSQMRSRVDLPCDVKGISHGMETRAKAHVMDFTRQGMFVASDTPLDEGTEMDAEIAIFQFGNTFWVRGKVLRRTNEGMAIKFKEKVPLDFERLLK